MGHAARRRLPPPTPGGRRGPAGRPAGFHRARRLIMTQRLSGWAPVADGEASPEATAKEALTEALAELSGLDPEVPVRPHVREGHAAEVLLRAASGADLLCRRQPGTWRTRIGDDGVRQPAMRAACPLPSPG